jgi:2-keto-4-pentenoate hydratase
VERIQKAARFLADRRDEKTTFDDLPPEIKARNLDEAYDIQDALVELLLQKRGARLIGYKVACTNTLAQEQLKVDGPVFGRLLSNVVFDSPAKLDAASFTRRIIEPEYAFIMAQDAPQGDGPYTPESISEKIQTVLPGLELVDHRFTDWSLVGGLGLAQDNAYNGGWVRGAAYSGDWRGLNLKDQTVTLTSSSGEMLTGSGGAVLGHPLKVMAWLANKLNSRGLMLKKGQYVTTGVTTDILTLERGDSAKADFGPLGSVEVSY